METEQTQEKKKYYATTTVSLLGAFLLIVIVIMVYHINSAYSLPTDESLIAPDMAWYRADGESRNEGYNKVIIGVNDSYVVVGYTDKSGNYNDNLSYGSPLIIRYNVDGAELWRDTLSGSYQINNEENYFVGAGEFYSVAGASDSYVAVGSYDASYAIIAKYDQRGQRVWTQLYRPDNGGNALANNVYADLSGYLVSINVAYPTGEMNLLIKYDEAGNILWQRQMDSSSVINIFKVDNNYVVVTTNQVLTYDINGYYLGSTYLTPITSITKDQDGNYLATGDDKVIKYDRNFSIIWFKNLEGYETSSSYGNSYLIAKEDPANPNKAIITKLDTDGNVTFERAHDSFYYNKIEDIMLNDGTYTAVGTVGQGNNLYTSYGSITKYTID